MLLHVGLDVAVAGAGGEGEDVHIHVEAEIFRQQILEDHFAHPLVVDLLQVGDVVADHVRLIALDALVAALIEEQTAGLAAVGVFQPHRDARRAVEIAAGGQRVVGGVGRGGDGAVDDVDEGFELFTAEAFGVAAAVVQRHQIIDEGGAQLRRRQNGDVAVFKTGNDVAHQAVRRDQRIVAAFDDGAR